MGDGSSRKSSGESSHHEMVMTADLAFGVAVASASDSGFVGSVVAIASPFHFEVALESDVGAGWAVAFGSAAPFDFAFVFDFALA